MIETKPSVCPHDCPSTCGLLVEVKDNARITRVRGADMPYVEGVICAKVANYAERVHNANRVLHPMRRIGPKGSGQFQRITWDEAIGEIKTRLQETENKYGKSAIWPYWYAGTMGVVQHNAMLRLGRAMGWRGLDTTICGTIAASGWMAGVGAKWGMDPREGVHSDLIVIWGSNPVATQVQIMSIIAKARKERGTKVVVIDPYCSPTAEKADLHLMPRPGTDGALAVAMMHIAFRDGLFDQEYLERYTNDWQALQDHVANRTPQWAAGITGLDVQIIEDFARLYLTTKRSWIRVGYGMSRSRNGAVNLHAVSCLPALTGAWEVLGGGATQSMGGTFQLQKTLAEGHCFAPPAATLDMCQIGRVLTGDTDALRGGGPVHAILIQSTNPATVAPESALVAQGLARDDLFVVVHEQMMTQTAKYADILLPATTSMEHADLYTPYGHTMLQVAKPVIAPLGEAKTNHQLAAEIARAMGDDHPLWGMDEWQLIDEILHSSDYPSADELFAMGWLDRAKSFEDGHFLNGFGHADGKFRFAPGWDSPELPRLPDHVALTEQIDEVHTHHLMTPPNRHFLNTSFTECPQSLARAKRPMVLMERKEADQLGITDGALVRIGNKRGSVVVHASLTDGKIAPKTLIVEGIWPDDAFVEGKGINHLTGADPVLPKGGAAFHDNAVWIRPEK